MASTALLTVEQYLNTHFEYEPEFVEGEIIERSMPTTMHALLTVLLAVRLQEAGCCLAAARLRLAEKVIRIPDLCVYHQFPKEKLPTSPPFITVEIVSPDDRHERLLKKLEQYRAWGVKNIWVVEPELRKFHVYDSRGLTEVEAFELPHLRIDAEELFLRASVR